MTTYFLRVKFDTGSTLDMPGTHNKEEVIRWFNNLKKSKAPPSFIEVVERQTIDSVLDTWPTVHASPLPP